MLFRVLYLLNLFVYTFVANCQFLQGIQSGYTKQSYKLSCLALSYEQYFSK